MRAVLLTAFVLSAFVQGTHAQLPALPASPPDADTCLACHADPSLTMTTTGGTAVPVHVDGAVFSGSVHAKLACADCHSGKSDLPTLAGILAEARAVVSNDSWAMHLAGAVGTKVVAVFGPTDRAARARRGNPAALWRNALRGPI